MRPCTRLLPLPGVVAVTAGFEPASVLGLRRGALPLSYVTTPAHARGSGIGPGLVGHANPLASPQRFPQPFQPGFSVRIGPYGSLAVVSPWPGKLPVSPSCLATVGGVPGVSAGPRKLPAVHLPVQFPPRFRWATRHFLRWWHNTTAALSASRREARCWPRLHVAEPIPAWICLAGPKLLPDGIYPGLRGNSSISTAGRAKACLPPTCRNPAWQVGCCPGHCDTLPGFAPGFTPLVSACEVPADLTYGARPFYRVGAVLAPRRGHRNLSLTGPGYQTVSGRRPPPEPDAGPCELS